MKNSFRLIYSALSLLVLTSFSGMPSDKFRGIWYRNTECDDDDSFCQVLIVKNTTDFTVIENQLALGCKNVVKNDTLFLYVIDHDAGRGFTGPYYPPKTNSLFAKCYLAKKELHIIYTQKIFKDHIKEWELPTKLYRHN